MLFTEDKTEGRKTHKQVACGGGCIKDVFRNTNSQKTHHYLIIIKNKEKKRKYIYIKKIHIYLELQ